MIRISIQFFGGRGSKMSLVRTKLTPSGYATYSSAGEADAAMGLGNGGEADKWQSSLTNDERSAVENYSGSSYYTLNEALRDGTTGDLKGFYKDMDKNLESALNNYTLEKPTTFVRGSSADLLGGASTVSQINAMKGQMVMDNGYTSSSATKGFSDDIVYHINTPSGKGIGAYIKGLSYHKTENEFLFNKRSVFVIKNAYQLSSYGSVHVELDYYGRASE